MPTVSRTQYLFLKAFPPDEATMTTKQLAECLGWTDNAVLTAAEQLRRLNHVYFPPVYGIVDRQYTFRILDGGRHAIRDYEYEHPEPPIQLVEPPPTIWQWIGKLICGFFGWLICGFLEHIRGIVVTAAFVALGGYLAKIGCDTENSTPDRTETTQPSSSTAP